MWLGFAQSITHIHTHIMKWEGQRKAADADLKARRYDEVWKGKQLGYSRDTCTHWCGHTKAKAWERRKWKSFGQHHGDSAEKSFFESYHMYSFYHFLFLSHLFHISSQLTSSAGITATPTTAIVMKQCYDDYIPKLNTNTSLIGRNGCVNEWNI